jgi:alpha-glucosidase
MPLPALWALGYHQCRWGYRSADEFRQIAAELRQRNLPADALWFDIDYMDGYRVFTWDRKRFRQPARLVAELTSRGLRAVTIVDPGVKVDEDYAVYAAGQQAGYFITHTDGREYHGSVWPGRSAFPDFHRAEVRAWWARLVSQWVDDHGLSGLWIDMNEPGVTDLSGPISDAVHDGGKLPHASARNTYALQMARATFDGLLAHAPDSRPFILTRAAYSGAQTVAALWAGDNSPHWEHLAGSVPMLLSLGLSGMPFVGADIGGFAGDTNAELLARWFQLGAFYPFCRNHAMAGTNRHEPWAFGPEVEAICRRWVELRYQLLPYSYGLFREAAESGAPIMRPLVWHYPRDPATFNLSDQFLYGPDLLVAPITLPAARARAVYLPPGRWYAWNDDRPHAGGRSILAEAPLSHMPLYVRAGAIIPMWPAAAHTGARQVQALRMHLWPGKGRLDYYEDDGETRAYLRGSYRLTRFELQAGRRGLKLRWARPEGAYQGPRDRWLFVLHDAPSAKARLDGQAIRAQREGRNLVIEVPDDGRDHVLAVGA